MVTRVDERELPRLLSVAEAAHLLNVSERLVWRMIPKGEIRSIRLGGRRMIPRTEVDRLATDTAQRS
jgi:excisionase family DNA binding protein